MNHFFSMNRGSSEIDQGVRAFLQTPGACLLDVRTSEEYAEGHIPKSFHLPLGELHTAPQKLKDTQQPLFVYCRSGARSKQAVAQLKQMGYTKAVNIGGILNYTGKLEL